MPPPIELQTLSLPDQELLLRLALRVGQDGFLSELCRAVSARLGCRGAIVGEVTDWTLRRCRVLALHLDGAEQDPFEYDLPGTPCEAVYLRGTTFHPQGIQEQFPDDHWLIEHRLESYYGIPFTDAAGVPLGHLAVLDGTARTLESLELPLLQPLGTLVRAELLRRHGERERLTLQRKLLQQQRIESLGALTHGVAGELRELMTSVGERIAQLLGSGVQMPAGETLQAIERDARRAGELTARMLEHAGQGQPSMQREDLSVLVGALEPLARNAVPAGARLELALAPDLPPIAADATQLRQLVLNLVLNAAEAIGERRGRITLTTSLVELDAEEISKAEFGREWQPGRYVCVEVRDDGCGIPAELRGRIFDPFFSTKGVGRGMGLAAVERILRTHTGVLLLASTPGSGTWVRVCFPPLAAIESCGSLRGRRVLVVEDDAGVARAMARSLRTQGCEVRIARSGAECLHELEGVAPPDVVLLDLGLPDMPGSLVYEELRARLPGLAIVQMSGGDDGNEEGAGGRGRTGFLPKPFSADQLEHALQRLLDES